jgi:DNA mismatch repair ATPase MutS
VKYCRDSRLNGIVHWQLPVSLILLQLLVVYAFDRRTKMVHQKITSLFPILQKYALALSLIEKASFNITFNKRLQDELKLNEQDPPSQVIRRFSQLLNWMDENLNLIFSVILNGLFMFNIHMLIAVEEWRLKYRNLIPKWFAVLAEFEALSGLAAFSFNNPDFVFPELKSGEYMLNTEKVGHPLIPVDTCVTNDFEIRGWKQFYIITGANMSGKSTFLRAIGTNYILAMIGAPVFAEKFIFTPVEIHSSIRTNDSLVKGESYFYAELKCLKEIIRELELGQRKLILLDEILKGTNSSDKQSGSIALIKQLMRYDVVGIFATHDIAISALINSYPDHIRNLCFEISIENDRMEIDYKLRPGVCKNLNASYLMKKMGIVLE